MNSSTERSSYLLRTTKIMGVTLFAVTVLILIPGCGGGDTNTGSEGGLTAMSANPKGTPSARNPGSPVAWSPDSLYASLAPGGSTMFQVEFTPSVNATGVTTFVVPEIADHVLLNPSSFTSLAAGQTYWIDVTLTSPPGMEVAEKNGVIMLRQGRRALARPLPVNLSFAPKTYTVTATATAGGEISPSSQEVALGDVAEFTLQRNPNFGISRVTGCAGARVGNSYTTAPIVESCAVEAVFGELVFFGSQPINDTGIDWCADAANNYDDGGAAYKRMQCEAVTIAGFPGQDGHFGRDALARAGQLPKIGDGAAGFDYTKISNSGAELPASATLGSSPNDWACTRDNLTWLIWEVKTNDGGLRHRNHTYTWYDPNSPDGIPGTPNGGSCVGSDCDTTGFVEAVNARGLCGARDWRMPTVDELLSINHLGRVNPAIDSTFFPNTPPYWFWSSTPEARYTDTGIAAFPVRFSYGGEGWGLKSYSHRVRLVRSGR